MLARLSSPNNINPELDYYHLVLKHWLQRRPGHGMPNQLFNPAFTVAVTNPTSDCGYLSILSSPLSINTLVNSIQI